MYGPRQKALSLGSEKLVRYSLQTVWPDLAKIHHFGKILKAFDDFYKLSLVFGKYLNLLWKNTYTIG